MFKTKLIILFVFCCPCCFGVVVNTTWEFQEALDNQEALIELDAQRFTLSMDLIVNYNCHIKPHDSMSQNGGVIIECNFNQLILKDAAITIGSYDVLNPLVFSRGCYNSVTVLSNAAFTSIDFWNCSFILSYRNGLCVLDGQEDVFVTCHNCIARDNNGDGFSLHCYGGTEPQSNILILNNCSSFNNGLTSASNASGDGVTAHDYNQSVYIHGGEYYNNSKTGLAIVNGSECYVDGGALFYGNGGTSHFADVYASEASLLQVYDSSFMGLDYPSKGRAHIWADKTNVIIQKCRFFEPIRQEGEYLRLLGAVGQATVKNCLFEGDDNAITTIELSQGKKASVKNCTFSENAYHISGVDGNDILVQNNIFYGARTAAIQNELSSYSESLANGFNCFYGNADNIIDNSGNLLPSDFVSDPLFADPNNSDYHLFSKGGRWEDELPNYDLSGDRVLDLRDFSIIASYWNIQNISCRFDFDGSGDVDTLDFLLLIEHFLEFSDIYDLNGDHFTDLADFSIFSMEWQQGQWETEADYNSDRKIDMDDLQVFLDNYLSFQEYSGWIQDAETSPCIDAGSPNAEYQAETHPNGGRINIGAYGGTPEASRSIF